MFDAQREAALEAAQAGAAVLMRHFRRLDPATISEKTRHDYVSIADQESEAAIRQVLDFHFPQYGFVGEELVVVCMRPQGTQNF